MKRLALILIVIILAIAAIAYTFHVTRKARGSTIASLLPRDTIALVHIPDFRRTRDQWHQSDIYQLWHESAVQEFLRQPLTTFPSNNVVSEILQELEQLDAKEFFVALTSIEARSAGFVAGFRFRGSRDAANPVITKWRARLLGENPNSRREKIAYREHEIDVAAVPAFALATAYDGRWFFASNDIEKLKELLDRADKRSPAPSTQPRGAQDRQLALQSDEAYRAAIAHIPSDYALLVYLQPKAIAEKLASIGAALGQQIASDQYSALRRINSICASTRFEHGKIHDVLFTGVDQLASQRQLTRSSATLGTTDTFFYLATLIDSKNWGGLGSAASITPVGGWLEKFLRTLSTNGVTAEGWNSAFDPELSSLAEWPPTAHWPSFFVTVPVKDPVRADQVARVITTAIDEDGRWMKSEKDGVRYFSLETPVRLFALTPTIALSERLLVAGLDPVSVEAAMKRNSESAGLSNSQSYRAAARALPPPTNLFAYIDTAVLYSRLDSTLRPMLLLGAAFLPAISARVALDKLPAPETVTKHLSPIVSSQRADRDGYVSESLGPVTLNQAALALAAAAIYSAVARQPTH
ncbi:MAG: hypothetical protein ABR514_01075 [Chthoniobacterales bacterium]